MLSYKIIIYKKKLFSKLNKINKNLIYKKMMKFFKSKKKTQPTELNKAKIEAGN
jgi:hypothetical protein